MSKRSADLDGPTGPSEPGSPPMAGSRPPSSLGPSADSAPLPWPPGVSGPTCDEPTVPHLGVLFVHGVGYQLSGEIFRSNSARLVRFLREAMYPDDPLRDPVRYGTRSVGWNEQPLIEIALPVTDEQGKRSSVHWVLSEAYWASTFEPPDLGTVAEWLGPGQGAARAARRLRYPGSRTGPPPAEDGSPPDASIGPLEALVSVGVAIVLGVYSLLRGLFAIIPIQALRTALIGPIDRFLTQWAGDMRIMLFDEGQASIIRDRVARAAKTLALFGCGQTVVIAHSGGVVSTYMTLTDGLYSKNLAIPLYITYGQGLAVAWRLLGIGNQTNQQMASRIGGRLADRLPSATTWFNYWGTDDPVPAGPLDDPPPPAGRARNIRVNNTWATREDHNAYFDNDEEFVHSIVEKLWSQVPGGDWTAAVSRATGHDQSVLVAGATRERDRRLSRVGVHSMWASLVSSATSIAILGAIFVGLVGYWIGVRDALTRPFEDITDAISDAWATIPGTEVLDEPAEFLHDLDFWWLALIGYCFWTVILILAAWFLLRPPAADWRVASGGRFSQLCAAGFVATVAIVAQGVAYLAGLPGLLGVAIGSTPWWRSEWPQETLNRGVEDVVTQVVPHATLGPILAGLLRNLLMFAALALVAVVVIGIIRTLRNRGPAALRVIGLTAYSAGIVVIIVGAAYAVVVSPGFASNLLGWALIAVLLSLLGKIGDWRWHQWDLQERWEARASLRGAIKRRRWGRKLDAVVFATVGTAVVGIAFAIAARPLALDAANVVILAGTAAAGIAMLAGGAQDYINQEQPTADGTSPTDVPTAASRAL